MISKVECEVLECDNCKDIYENGSGYSIFADGSAMKADASDDGWEMNYESGKHYCDKCHEYNDDDELIINPTRKKVEGEDSISKDSTN